jgi:VIT1/CCC1 family predicted Fe2+/Mn2+ transporter
MACHGVNLRWRFNARKAAARPIPRAAPITMAALPSNRRDPPFMALWMLLADFLSAVVPILPFVFFPIPQARLVSAAGHYDLADPLGVGRARIAKRSTISTIMETASIGVAAALAGVAISLLIDRWFSEAGGP